MNEKLFKQAFSFKLKNYADEIGMSYKDLAKYCGVCRTTMYYYFTGKRLPDLITLIKISEVLMVSPGELLNCDYVGMSTKFLNEGSDFYVRFDEDVRKRIETI